MLIWSLSLHPAAAAQFGGGYDSFSAFIVTAPSETDARALVTRCGDECRRHASAGLEWYGDEPERPCVWHNPAVSACECIGVAVEGRAAGVECESFHAG